MKKKLVQLPTPDVENVYATAAAAETLKMQGNYKGARKVRDLIAGDEDSLAAMDPMELLILIEDHVLSGS